MNILVSEMRTKSVVIDYTNHRGERRERIIEPLRLWFGENEYHPTPQWLVTAWDCEKYAQRVFAVSNIHSWRATDKDGNRRDG